MKENTCKIFKCSIRSLFKWIKRYEEIKKHNRTYIIQG
jgi:hypothetical protein